MIYADLKGRLGNQMFIYAFAYALSRQNGNEKICFCGSTENRLYNFNLQNVDSYATQPLDKNLYQRLLSYEYAKKAAKLSRTALFKYEKQNKSRFVKSGMFLCQNGFIHFERTMCKKENIYTNGFFQSEKYFFDYKDELKKIFTPIKPVAVENTDLYNRICSDKASVCVDFRLGDYINNSLHGVCTLDYYKNAMTALNNKLERPVFYIFSTDVEYIKEVTKDWNFNITIESGKSGDYEKLRLMSACKHFIITNSTYDWWAQYLAENPNKTVIAPSKWFAQECPCDIYQDNWTLMDC